MVSASNTGFLNIGLKRLGSRLNPSWLGLEIQFPFFSRSSSLRHDTTYRPRFGLKCKRPVSVSAQNILPQSLFYRFTVIFR